MSPETTTTGRRDFVQAVAEKVRRDISSMGPKEAPKPPQEPKAPEGTVDLAEHSKKMGEHREAVTAHEEKQREYDEAQAKREEAGTEYKSKFQKAQADVQRLEEERAALNPRNRDEAARYSEELGAVAETTVKYLVGVQEGIITFDHIADPEVRSFAERAVKTIAEKALKVADPSTVLESYKLIQQLSSGDMNMETLQELYGTFRDTAGRTNRTAIADLSAAFVSTFNQTEEEELQAVFATDKDKGEFMEEMREVFVAEAPDTRGMDALMEFESSGSAAEQIRLSGRSSEGEAAALRHATEAIFKAVKTNAFDPKEVYDGNLKMDGFVHEVIGKLDQMHVADNALFAAQLYPAIHSLIDGTVTLQGLERVFDKFTRQWGLEDEQATLELKKILSTASAGLKGNHEHDEELRAAKERFFGEALSDDEIDTRIEKAFDPEAVSPYSQLEQKYGKIMEVYTDVKDKKLLRAIFDADEYLETYLEEALGQVEVDRSKVEARLRKQLGIKDDETVPDDVLQAELRTEATKKLSLDFKDEVALLFGKLFKTVDEEAPATYWSEAVQQGDMWTQTANLAATFTKSLERVRDLKFKDGSIVHELVWTRRGEEYSAPSTVKGKTGERQEMVRYSSTYKKDIKLHDWHEYMLLVSKGVSAMEGIKRYVHDARATQYNPAPEGGHLGQLKQFADSHMSSLDFDSFYELPDSEIMLEGAQLWDAMSRIRFAESNWVVSSSGDIDHESGVPEADKLTLKYLRQHEGKGDGEVEEWRVRQAASLGAGHHFTGMSLSGVMGAWADAPQDLKGGHVYRSYGVRDAEAYSEINPLRHILHRFRASGMNTTVMYTPIGTINEDGTIKWGRDDEFSYEDLQLAEQRFKNATVHGKHEKDVGVIRVIDIMNPGKLGDMVYRGGWRDEASVEHWYTDRVNGSKLTTIDKLTVNEHIGPEYVKKFLAGIGGSDLFETGKESEQHKLKERGEDTDPYKDVVKITRADLDGSIADGATEGENIAKRREFVTHVAERYFKDEFTHTYTGKPEDFDTAWKKYINDTMDKLEGKTDAQQAEWRANKRENSGKQLTERKPTQDTAKQLKDRYKAWGMEAAARAMLLQDPTLFLTIERNNEVTGRTRAWDQVKRLVEQSYVDDAMASDFAEKVRDANIMFDDVEDIKERGKKIENKKKELYQKHAKMRSELLDSEAYRHAVEDLAAVSAAVTKQCRDDKWEKLNAGDTWVHQIELGTSDFVTEDKIISHMEQMRERGILGTDEEAAARIDLTLRVYRANREFSYGTTGIVVDKNNPYKLEEDAHKIVNEAGVSSSFIDAMGFKLGLPWPLGFHRAIGVGSVDFRALALREAGSRMPARVLGDASSLAQGTAKSVEEFVLKLVEVAGVEDRSEGNKALAEIMKKAQTTMNGVHGKKDAYEITAAIMTPMAVRMFRADSNVMHMVRAGYGRLRESLGDVGNKYAGKYRSLSEAVSGASNWHGARVDKPEDTRAMLDMFADPQIGVIPQSRYDSAVQPKYEYDEESKTTRRVADFDELTLKDVAEKAKATRTDVLRKWAKLAPLYLAAGGTLAILATLVRGLKKELSGDRS